jgi:tRNA (guanine-N7-)-methyltransferase
MRTVRSYVVRGGRMTVAQSRALSEHWLLFGIDFSAAELDLAQLFGRQAPCTLEIGFGNGAHLAARARSEPERDFIGVEVHRPGIGALLQAAAGSGLRNLRVINHDAIDVLREQIAPAALDELQILFPDPWHKKRHHKRRLIQAEFVNLAAGRLRVGGRLHLATDWEPYAEQMQAVLAACPLLENAVPGSDYAARPDSRVATRFERRGMGLGHVVRDLLWRRVVGATQ